MNSPNTTSQARFWASGILLLSLFPGAAAQTQRADWGGTFRQLHPEQQALVRRWAAEYEAVLKRRLAPEDVYDQLPLSARTTLQAVTHALMNSKLTSKDGKPMGTALDLVDVVERVSGHVPDTRGDRQFRIYVYLKPGAVNRLYAAREFERQHDNTVYHIGYPLNFRQQGGVPSIQISVTRTGKRADIDVDYRSSSPAKALFSGHLTSANSDVRAGNNHLVHNRRWSGLSNWWQSLMAVFIEKAAPEEPAEGLTPGAELERRKIAQGPIHQVIHAYLTDWLIKRRPEDLMPLFSVKSYPCVAELGDGSRPDSKMALLRFLRHMQEINTMLGPVNRLEDVVSAVSYRLPGSVPVPHPYERLFSLQEVPADVAWAIDCRVRYKLQMAESIPRPPHELNKTYVVSMRIKNPKEPKSFVVHTWSRESGEWRFVSGDIKHKTFSPPADLLAAAGPLPPKDSDAARVSDEAEELLALWLMKRQTAEAAKFFLPESHACDAFAESHPVSPGTPGTGSQQDLSAFLEEVAKHSHAGERLEDVIAPVEADHHELKQLAHERSGAFVLAEVNGDLLQMSDCAFGLKTLTSRTPAAPPAAKVIATFFRLVHTEGEEPAAITLYWKKTPDGWRVASYSVTAD